MTSPAGWLNDGPRLDGVRVLVVDDARDVREAVTDILAEDGAKVTAVGSAEEALAALQGERPDVLLSDLAMPGKGGYWLIAQVRAAPTRARRNHTRRRPHGLHRSRTPRERPEGGVPAPCGEAHRARCIDPSRRELALRDAGAEGTRRRSAQVVTSAVERPRLLTEAFATSRRFPMPRRPPAHIGAELSGRITALEIARAQLFDVDVDRKKRIDGVIDYFGARHIDVARDGADRRAPQSCLPQ